MASLNNISVEGFKAQFTRDFPYLPVWDGDKVYFKGDIVYYLNAFYQSLVDANDDIPTEDSWTITNQNINNYISDSDIERAFSEAKLNFNPNFFEDDSTAEMVFYYLTAHYLVIDLNNAMNSFSLGFIGYTQSKSVGSVSESYGVPAYMLNNPILSGYAQTGYGRKYLSLIMPYLVGQLIFTPGRTTIG